MLVREAIEEYYLKKAARQKVSKAIDDLLGLPEMAAPENYQDWEKQYQKDKYSSI